MILHIVKCEMCPNQFTFRPFERAEMLKAPEGWFTLFLSRDIAAQEGWHFCSALCLGQWAIVRDEELRKA